MTEIQKKIQAHLEKQHNPAARWLYESNADGSLTVKDAAGGQMRVTLDTAGNLIDADNGQLYARPIGDGSGWREV